MTTAAKPSTPRVKRHAELNTDRFALVAKAYGWDTNAATARALGVSESTISRALSPKQDISMQFLLGVLDVAEDLTSFRRMFKIVTTVSDEQEEANTE